MHWNEADLGTAPKGIARMNHISSVLALSCLNAIGESFGILGLLTSLDRVRGWEIKCRREFRGCLRSAPAFGRRGYAARRRAPARSLPCAKAQGLG
jgi:hypothetical protein